MGITGYCVSFACIGQVFSSLLLFVRKISVDPVECIIEGKKVGILRDNVSCAGIKTRRKPNSLDLNEN